MGVCFFRMVLQETYEIEDLIFYSLDGTDLTGTYETGSDGTYNYITNLKGDVQLSNLNLPSHFVFSMKYCPNNTGGWGNSLWLIGSDLNNGVLIGAEGTNTRLRIYDWTNGSPSSQQVLNSSFSTYEWNELEIEYDNGVWTSRVGTNSVTWSKTFNPTLIKNYSDIPKSMLCMFKIKAL